MHSQVAFIYKKELRVQMKKFKIVRENVLILSHKVSMEKRFPKNKRISHRLYDDEPFGLGN